MRLALALTSAQADRLRKEADRLGIAPAVLVRATLEDLCDLPDAGFRAAAERIVPKHQELSLVSPDQGVEHVGAVNGLVTHGFGDRQAGCTGNSFGTSRPSSSWSQA